MVKADSEGSTRDRVEPTVHLREPVFLMRTIDLKGGAPGPARRWFIGRLEQA
jgi:hypothetical protein